MQWEQSTMDHGHTDAHCRAGLTAIPVHGIPKALPAVPVCGVIQ